MPGTTARPAHGAVLVRLPASGSDWAAGLPKVPDGQVLTLTVGHPSLLPVPADDLVASGYRIVGVAPPERTHGACVDVLVPRGLREGRPEWWRELVTAAERVFDLRLGPVWAVLGHEIELHLSAASG